MRPPFWSALVAMALSAFATSASAAVNFTSSNSYDTNGYGLGESLVWNFDGLANPDFSYVGSVLPYTVSNVGAAPAGDSTFYGLALPGADATFAINSGSFSSLSLYLGSLDDYNTISFYSGATLVASFTGTDLTSLLSVVADGDPAAGETNRRYFFTFGAADNVNRVVFNTTTPAFEFDNIAAAISGVPEPSTWTMLILGFGMIGFMIRNSRGQGAKAMSARGAGS